MKQTKSLLVLLAGFLVLSSCSIHTGMREMKTFRYEAGEHLGAKACGTCHQTVYEQWLNNSRHAIATTIPSFHEFKKEVEDSFLLNTMMGTEFCFGCHGPEKVDNGVDCETCHGPAGRFKPQEAIHENGYKPRVAEMRENDFCLKCHSLKNPMTNAQMMMDPKDIGASRANTDRLTCQNCHMEKVNGYAYHGFDSAVIGKPIYKDDLAIENVRLENGTLKLTVRNNVAGHPIPAGGAVRALALDIFLLDNSKKELHHITKTFGKKFVMMPVAGIMPWKLIENTQLQSGEARELTFDIPQVVVGSVITGRFTLRFYEVMDKYQSDLAKAHWIGDPFLDVEKQF